MPEEKPHWGTQAIRDAEMRHTDKMVITTINPGTRWHLQLKVNKETGTAYINGHPFMNSAFAISEIARKFGSLHAEAEAERRRAIAETSR
jgi:hypothetical protein